MQQAIEFRFRFLHEPGDDRAVIEEYANGLADVNTAIIGRAPDRYSACLGCSHLKYVDAPSCYRTKAFGGKERIPGCQPIVAADMLAYRGTGTCIDLACYLAAARRVHFGERNRVSIEDQGGGLYHAVVVDGMGRRLDPQQIALKRHCEAGCNGNVVPMRRVAGRGPVIVQGTMADVVPMEQPSELTDAWVVGET